MALDVRPWPHAAGVDRVRLNSLFTRGALGLIASTRRPHLGRLGRRRRVGASGSRSGSDSLRGPARSTACAFAYAAPFRSRIWYRCRRRRLLLSSRYRHPYRIRLFRGERRAPDRLGVVLATSGLCCASVAKRPDPFGLGLMVIGGCMGFTR